MDKEKIRILVRIQPVVYDCLELEAIYEGIRVGSLANKLLREELLKILEVGIDNCIIAERASAEPNQYALLPKGKLDKYMPLRRGKTINKQVSFYITDTELQLLNKIVYLQDIPETIDGDKITSYRFAITGILLNSNIFQKIRTETAEISAKAVAE